MEHMESIKLIEEDGFDDKRDVNEESNHGDEERDDSVVKRIWRATLHTVSARRGVFYAITAGVLLGCQLSAVKAITLSPYQIMVLRSFLFLPCIIFVSWNRSNDYDVIDLMCYISYGVFNSLGLLLAYVALQLAQIGNVSAISSNLPIPSTLLAFVFFKEPLTIFGVTFLIINLIGLILVSQPPFLFPSGGEDVALQATFENSNEFVGALIAFMSLIGLSLATIFTRKLTYRGNVDPALLSFIPGTTGVVISGAVLLFSQTWDYFQSVEEGFICLLVGILSAAGNLLIVLALKYEDVSLVTIQFTLSAPVAFVLGLILFQEIPDFISVIGATLILGSTFGLLWRK
ncbi:solute carrier family 35 member G1-like [Apostichopus japonicus]|uniref:solute carrier family 35 member G1-like n=1 Tax=Stichopus japonicus TaxID=307972 RepID=UPI003AB54BDE